MNVRYGIVKEIYSLNENTIASYGIAAYVDSSENDSLCIINSVRNITCDIMSIEKLTDMCNRLELSPIHLNDVIEDFLIGCAD